MGLTISNLTRRSVGDEFEIRANAVWNATYDTNGASLTPEMLGLMSIKDIPPIFKSGFVMEFIPSTSKLKAFRSATFAPAFVGTPATPAGSVAAPVFSGTPVTFGTAAGAVSFSRQNVKGADAAVASSDVADQNAAPTNGDFVDTKHAVTAGPAWAYSENLELDLPRNVCILLQGKTGTGSVIPDGDYKFVVTGFFLGAAQTETITFTFTSSAGTIAADKYRWQYGVKPFDSITDVVINSADLADLPVDLIIGVGLGRLLGVPVQPVNGVVGDFTKITKNSANISAVAYNDTNKTLDVGALADNDDFDIEVMCAGVGGAYTPAGTNSAPGFTGVQATPAGSIAASGQAALAEVTAGVTLSSTPGSFVIVARGLGL